MEPTEAMKTYIDLDLQIKQLEVHKKKIRPEVLKELKDNPDIEFKGISLSVMEKIDFVYPEFYNWVGENFPDKLDEVRKKEIDEEEFGRLYALGEIEYEELPEDLFNLKKIDRITVRKIK